MTAHNLPPELPDEPDVFSPVSLQALHTTYLTAIALADADDICWAGNQFYETDGYLLTELVDDARTLSSELYANPAKAYEQEIEAVLSTGIRAYVYSGVPVRAPLVSLVTRLCGLDRFWLKDTVAPSAYVVRDVLQATGRSEQKLLKARGNAALGSLGLRSFQVRTRWKDL